VKRNYSKSIGVLELSDTKYNPPAPTEVLIAALNEEKGVSATISEIKKIMRVQRILVVDGHSHDGTVEAAKDSGAEVVFQNGKGKGDAIAKAIQCMKADTKYAVITDADYTYPAEYLPEMIQILEQNPQVGMVCGNRFHDKPEGPAFKGRFCFGNKLLAFAHGYLNGVYLKDPMTGLRVIRADILRNWTIKSRSFDIEVELNSQVATQRFETIEVPILYRERIGEKKLKVRHGVGILNRILLESLKPDNLIDSWVDLFQI
jgi:dolichol-phosphate hexosyltransferase